MANIQFSIGDRNYQLYRQARAKFNRNEIIKLSDADTIEIFLKMLAIEEADDTETEQDLKKEIGWYDEDWDEPGSRFQKFLEEDEEEIKEPQKGPKKQKRK